MDPGRQSDSGSDWSQTRDDGALGASAVRRKNGQFARRKQSSSPGSLSLMAGFVGPRVERGELDLASATSGRFPMRLINREADSPCEASGFADSSE